MQARRLGRVDGGLFDDTANALGVGDGGRRGSRRAGHGPRVVMVPVMRASMAA